MASIRKRKNSYQITVSNGRDYNGKQIIETTTFTPPEGLTEKQIQKQLQRFAYEFEEKVRNGKIMTGDKMTLADFSEKWLSEYAVHNVDPTTVEKYTKVIKIKILPVLGHYKLSKLKPIDIQSFYNSLTKDGARADGKSGGYSPATIQRYHNILRKMLKTALQWQMIDSNPCDRVTTPKADRSCDDVKFFTPEQAVIFLSALDEDYTVTYKPHGRIDDTGKPYTVGEYTKTVTVPLQFKVLYNIALFGGLRKGELLALTWDDIDYKNNTISINKPTAVLHGKQITKAPKTHSSIRTITIPQSLTELIKQYRKAQAAERLRLGSYWHNTNYLFTQVNGEQMNYYTPYHTFKDIIKKHNDKVMSSEKIRPEDKKELLLPDIPLHGLRHTTATLLISKAIDVRTVAARLGHSQTSTTMNIYAHALKESDRAASESLSEILGNRKIEQC